MTQEPKHYPVEIDGAESLDDLLKSLAKMPKAISEMNDSLHKFSTTFGGNTYSTITASTNTEIAEATPSLQDAIMHINLQKDAIFKHYPDLPLGWLYSAKIHKLVFIRRFDELNSQSVFGMIETLARMRRNGEGTQKFWKAILDLLFEQAEAYREVADALISMHNLLGEIDHD